MNQHDNKNMKSPLHRKLLRAFPLFILFVFINCSYGLINLLPEKGQRVKSTGEVTVYRTGGGPTFDMIYVEAGLEFQQGVDDAGDIVYDGGLSHTAPPTATVSRAYEIGETEVTYELWEAVYDWATTDAGGGLREDGGELYTFANAGVMGDSDTGSNQQPVTDVSWRDSIVWCNALTEYYNRKNGTNLSCVYFTDNVYNNPLRESTNNGTISTTAGSEDNPYIKAVLNGNTDIANCTAKGFRLPTTTEWGAASRWEGSSKISTDAYEYPTNSGIWWTSGSYASGGTGPRTGVAATDYPDFAPFAWYGNSLTEPDGNTVSTQPVEGRTANALGLYDMSGNVWEWNFDWHPDHIDSARVLRGSSWSDNLWGMRLGFWYCSHIYTGNNETGFRFSRSQ